MTHCIILTIYGPEHACDCAKGILENHSGIRKIDISESQQLSLRLLCTKPMDDAAIIRLLSGSGLSGIGIKRRNMADNAPE